ncbi:hypothetical protein DFJ73DRAFT_916137 [Zopfochytrium polystomum]|nr:hypothetical protein DFJ73DRAFT_916137 [Zopfochytrium polystomum]
MPKFQQAIVSPLAVVVFLASAASVLPCCRAQTSARSGNDQQGVALASFCDQSSSFCVSARRDASSETITYVLQSSLPGWVGIGVGGSTMASTTIYVAYPDNKGGVTVSQRKTPGHIQPTLDTQDFTPVRISQLPPWATPLPGSVITAAFNRSTVPSVAGRAISTTGATPHIYGVCDLSASDGSPSAQIQQHIVNGIFTLDLSALGQPASTGTSAASSSILDPTTLKTLHAALMFAAWGVLTPAAVFVARHLKSRLGHAWYVLHASVAGGAVLALTALALLFIELAHPPGAPRTPFLGDDGAAGANAHRPVGTVVALVLLPVQVVLGLVANALFAPGRTAVPWWDRVHWWLGRATVLLAVAQMHLGILLLGGSTTVLVLYWVWIGTVVAAFVVAHAAWGGAVHHIKQEE